MSDLEGFGELVPSVALPLIMRTRITLQSDLPAAGIWDEEAALAILSSFTEEYGTPEAAFLVMMQKFNIKMDVLQAIGGIHSRFRGSTSR